MFQQYTNAMVSSPSEGVTRRILAHNNQLMLVEFCFEAGLDLPLHTHPHTQASYLASGKIQYCRGDETFTMLPGDSITIEPDIPHTIVTLEASILIDAFTPAREDFLQ